MQQHRQNTFVWKPMENTGALKRVEDIRIYVEERFKGYGYGHLMVQLVKAFFFQHRSGGPDFLSALPLSGLLGITSLTVLPTSKQAKNFYRKQGFQRLDARNKWEFEPEPMQIDQIDTIDWVLAWSKSHS